MPDVKAGRAFIELFLRDKSAQGRRRFMRSMQRMGRISASVARSLTTIGVVAGGVMAAGLIKAANAAGDMAETMNKFNIVFAGVVEETRNWADEFRKAVGVFSGEQVFSMLAGFQAMIRPMAETTEQAAEMSKTFLQLTADLASQDNRRTEDVFQDLMSMLGGSAETMDKYGVNVKKAAVNQELLNQSIDPEQADRYQIAHAKLNIILREANRVIGDAKNTSDSYANSVKTLTAEWNNLMTTLGQKFESDSLQAVQVMIRAFRDLQDVVSLIPEDFDLLDDKLVALAKEGKWRHVGELVGAAIEDGLRGAMGDFWVDALKIGGKAGERVVKVPYEALYYGGKAIDHMVDMADEVNKEVFGRYPRFSGKRPHLGVTTGSERHTRRQQILNETFPATGMPAPNGFGFWQDSPRALLQ